MNSRGRRRRAPGAARRRGADPRLRRARPGGGLRGPGLLRPGRLRGPAADGRDDGAQARRSRRRRCRGARTRERKARPATRSRAPRRPRPRGGAVPARSDVAVDNPIPTPPFWGTRVVKGIRSPTTPPGRRAGAVPRAVGPARRRAGQGPRTRSWSRPRAARGCASGWTGWRPRGCCRRRRSSTATSRRVATATRWSCWTSRGRTRGSGTASRSRASAATGTCAWPTSGGPRRRPGEVDVVAFQLVTMGQPIAELRERAVRQGRLPRLPRGARAGRAAHRGAGRVLARAGPRGARGSRGGRRRGPCDVEDASGWATAVPGTRWGTARVRTWRTGRRSSICCSRAASASTLSEELQLHPEQSTDALVAHHPEAKYFNAG